MKCRVWNDNPHTDWKELFKGEWVNIPKGKCIEMEFYEAHEFKGQYSPIKLRSDETQDPASFKMIRVEKITDLEDGEIEVQAETFPCNLCKKVFDSDDALLKHTAKAHPDVENVRDEVAEESIKKRPGRKPKAQAEATT